MPSCALVVLYVLLVLCLTNAQDLPSITVTDVPKTDGDFAATTVFQPVLDLASTTSTSTGKASFTTSSTTSVSTSSRGASVLRPHTGTSSRSRVVAFSHPAAASPALTFTLHQVPEPVPTDDTTSPTHPAHGFGGGPGHAAAWNHHRSQTVTAIVFEVIGGLAGILLVALCGRCMYTYHRTPRYDSVAAAIARHNLDRELAEMEEAPPARRISLVRPPPPYQCAPDYEEAVRQTPGQPP